MIEGVEAQDLIEFIDPSRVPASIILRLGQQVRHCGRGRELGEDPLLGVEVLEILVPLRGVVLVLQT